MCLYFYFQEKKIFQSNTIYPSWGRTPPPPAKVKLFHVALGRHCKSFGTLIFDAFADYLFACCVSILRKIEEQYYTR